MTELTKHDCFPAPKDKNRFLTVIGKELKSKYGVEKKYPAKSIEAVFEIVKNDTRYKGCSCWAIAMFSTEEEFNEWCSQRSNELTYQNMRETMVGPQKLKENGDTGSLNFINFDTSFFGCGCLLELFDYILSEGN